MSHELTALLELQLAQAPQGPLRVAFSGGSDSCALLHALVLLPQARARDLRALHVDHGLRAESAHWAAQCLDFCAQWRIPLELLAVRVPRDSGAGLEAAARDARYAALAARLPAGGLLVLAHHREDQAETVLLKLLRGAGPEGLGAMRTLRGFAGGQLWRPLLAAPRALLRGHLDAFGIVPIEDPANRDPAHARSYLRTQVWPLLQRHWPEAAASLSHVARVQHALAEDLATRAAHALREVVRSDTDTLDCTAWLALPDALRAPVLARWLRMRGLRAPDGAQRAALERALRSAARDRVPELRCADTVLRAWRGRLYAEPWQAPVMPDWSAEWNGAALALPGGARLALLRDDLRFALPLRVRATRAGERLRRADDTHTRSLGALFQQADVPPWQRARCPLIETPQGEPLALGDIALTARGANFFAALETRPLWRRCAAPEWREGIAAAATTRAGD